MCHPNPKPRVPAGLAWIWWTWISSKDLLWIGMSVFAFVGQERVPWFWCLFQCAQRTLKQFFWYLLNQLIHCTNSKHVVAIENDRMSMDFGADIGFVECILFCFKWLFDTCISQNHRCSIIKACSSNMCLFKKKLRMSGQEGWVVLVSPARF